MFAERVAEYRATVHRVREKDVSKTVARIAEETGCRRGRPRTQDWHPR